MAYKNLQECIYDLQKNGEIKVLSEEVNPDLEMASIHLDEFKGEQKTLLFENVKGSKFRAVSNIFGTVNIISATHSLNSIKLIFL